MCFNLCVRFFLSFPPPKFCFIGWPLSKIRRLSQNIIYPFSFLFFGDVFFPSLCKCGCMLLSCCIFVILIREPSPPPPKVCRKHGSAYQVHLSGQKNNQKNCVQLTVHARPSLVTQSTRWAIPRSGI